MSSKPDYWFPAKRYGWGWGLPARWEGWVVVVVYLVLIGVAVWMLPPDREPGAFVALVGVLSAALIAVCWIKGEPPRWRWGKD